MKKYINLGNPGSRDIILNRSVIVGFETADSRIYACLVLLDSGSKIYLNGIAPQQALEILNKFDEDNLKT